MADAPFNIHLSVEFEIGPIEIQITSQCHMILSMILSDSSEIFVHMMVGFTRKGGIS